MLTSIKSEQLRDIEFLRGLMNSSDMFDSMLMGKNEEEEDVFVSVNSDDIVVTTYQKNHRVRKKIYYRDGTTEEIFEGIW